MQKRKSVAQTRKGAVRKRRRKILGLVVLLALAIAVAASWQYIALTTPALSRDYTLHLPTGGDIRTLRDSIARGGASGGGALGRGTPGGTSGNGALNGGAFRSPARMRLAMKLLRMDEHSYHPGAYRLTRGMSYLRVARILKHGLQNPIKVTFNNQRSLAGLAGSLARQLESDSAAFAAIFADPATAARMGFSPQTFMVMFIPDTYELYWTTTPEAFVERMRKEYDRFWNAERTAKLAGTGLTREQVITLASIVYEETKMADEMPKVAGVYMNRLHAGMPLQADPTIKFAVGDFTLKRILDRHLAVDSPYNTYKYPGLPPGPISMPSVRAIDAVLGYSRHNYLYFCARPDFSGYHDFSLTLAEHNHRAALYRQALDRAGIR